MAKNEDPLHRSLAAQLTTFGLLELNNTYRLKNHLVHSFRFDGELSGPQVQDTIVNRKATHFYLNKLPHTLTKIMVRFYHLEGVE